MEDWKAAQSTRSEDDFFLEKKISTSEFHGPIDQQESAEVEKHSRNSQDPRASFQHPRLSVLDIEGDDWEEQDAGLRNAKEMAHTLMEKECAAEDVISVWEDVSKFIIFKLMESQAVRIAGLGTFTFRIQKTPVNQKEMKISKIPNFILSEHVAQMFNLRQDRVPTSHVPVVPLNLSMIANEAKLPRGMIEGIMTEVLQAFARGIVCNKSLEFPFPFIGKLQIRDKKVTMRFYDEFCKKLGFNAIEKPQSDLLSDATIPGRMTPLKMHTPSDSFRSVFHLREVRSVHQNSVLVPLVNIDGSYHPATIACLELNKCPVQPLLEPTTNPENPENLTVEESTNEASCPVQEENGQCVAADSKTSQNQNQNQNYISYKEFRPVEMYVPQKSGDCILDLMNENPDVQIHCLRAHMYKTFVNTLGADVVKSHFHRRGNHPPCRRISYTDDTLNFNCRMYK